MRFVPLGLAYELVINISLLIIQARWFVVYARWSTTLICVSCTTTLHVLRLLEATG